MTSARLPVAAPASPRSSPRSCRLCQSVDRASPRLHRACRYRPGRHEGEPVGGALCVDQRTIGPNRNEHLRRCVRYNGFEVVASEWLPPFEKDADETVGDKLIKETDPLIRRKLRIAVGAAIGVTVAASKIGAGGHRDGELEWRRKPGEVCARSGIRNRHP